MVRSDSAQHMRERVGSGRIASGVSAQAGHRRNKTHLFTSRKPDSSSRWPCAPPASPLAAAPRACRWPACPSGRRRVPSQSGPGRENRTQDIHEGEYKPEAAVVPTCKVSYQSGVKEHLAVVGGLSLSVLEEAQHGEGLHFVLHAQVSVGHAVHLHHAHRQLLPLHLRQRDRQGGRET